MIDIMDWNECEIKFIKRVEVDPSRIQFLVRASELRIKDLAEKKTTNENVSFVIEGFYEAIKELLSALLLKNGLRSKNHQCLISFFYKTYPEYEKEAYLIGRMSYLRNRLNYYGDLIEFEFYEKNKEEFNKIIKLLKKLISN